MGDVIGTARDKFWTNLKRELVIALECNTNLDIYACDDAAEDAINGVREDHINSIVVEESGKERLLPLLKSLKQRHYIVLDDYEKREVEFLLDVVERI